MSAPKTLGVVVNLKSVVIHVPKEDFHRLANEGRLSELNPQIFEILGQRDREGDTLAESVEEL